MVQHLDALVEYNLVNCILHSLFVKTISGESCFLDASLKRFFLQYQVNTFARKGFGVKTKEESVGWL